MADPTTGTPDFFELKKNLKKDFSGFPRFQLAILGDSSTQFLHQAIKGFGYEVGLNVAIYESDYGQIDQEIFNDQAGLYAFKPDGVFLFYSTQKLLSRFYSYNETSRSGFAVDQINKLRNSISRLKQNLSCKIILSNFVEIDDGVFGNFGNKHPASFIFQLRKLNVALMELAAEEQDVFINDISGLNTRVGLGYSFQPKLYINSDIVFSLEFTAVVARNLIDIVLPLMGRLKKCLILDLDNTMWGGIIGDDGMENIQIGDLGIGKAYTQLQQWALQLKQRGIILAVSSKNTESIAKEPFERHPDMVLRLDDISVFVANWENKADNIRYIQSILNIGFDSMVFIDDNPFERELVKKEIPAITVPELPEDPSKYLDFLRSLNLFETATYSEEDAERTRQYRAEAKRIVSQQAYSSQDEYLKSLQMRSSVKNFDSFNTPRVAQLTQRSNQFNLRTVRYTEGEIAALITSPGSHTLSFDLRDSFGDHGLIAALILKELDGSLFIDTWVMSCRVLSRGMEQFIINQVAGLAEKKKIHSITGEYLPTPKNGIVKELYPSLGFTENNGKWKLSVQDFKPFNTYIDAE